MTVYTPNIPQPTDNPSNSQDQILQNFQTLNSSYGTSGDHYAWTNTSPVEGFKHAKVTLPGLPTSSTPGNVIPNPLAGNCAVFGQTVDSQTTPFVTRDGLTPTANLTNIWPLLPIKAFATCSITAATVGSILLGYNLTLTSVVTTGPVVTLNFAITNTMRTNTYGVLATMSQLSNGIAYIISSPTVFSLRTTPTTGFPYNVTVTVLEP